MNRRTFVRTAGAAGLGLAGRHPAANPEAVRRSLVAALDKWDHEAADAAMAGYSRTADPTAVFSLLFLYGTRDLRAIGHKAITVSNAHSLMTLFDGGAAPEPMLRSTVAALLNSQGDPVPPSHDLAPDRPWRRNRERLHQIPASWREGRDDPGARGELRVALYSVSAEESGGVVVEMLQQGICFNLNGRLPAFSWASRRQLVFLVLKRIPLE